MEVSDVTANEIVGQFPLLALGLFCLVSGLVRAIAGAGAAWTGLAAIGLAIEAAALRRVYGRLTDRVATP